MATFEHNNNNKKPSLLDALSWPKIMPVKPLAQPSFTELFGELNFEENPNPNPNTSTTSTSTNDPMSMSMSSSFGFGFGFGFDIISKKQKEDENGGWGSITYHGKSESFSSSMNSESLQLCTEGLGFESSADVEDLKNENENTCYDDHHHKSAAAASSHIHNVSRQQQWGSYYHSSEARRARAEAFPPPISSIGRSGKPGVCFRSFRENGRFVLREIRIPTQEFLHASREDGRLKLHFVHPNDDDDDEEGQGEGEEEQACNDQENKEDIDEDD